MKLYVPGKPFEEQSSISGLCCQPWMRPVRTICDYPEPTIAGFVKLKTLPVERQANTVDF